MDSDSYFQILDDFSYPQIKDENSSQDEDSATEESFQPKKEVLSKPEIVEKLIGAINKIQDVFNTLKVPNSIELPQIVMLGSQSAGKSSVLESIVHRPFLPRGSGIVTRCPLVLQLVECKMNNTKYRKQENETTEIEEWGEFLHQKNKLYFDFDKICKEIERQTEKIAGKNKGISDKPINLKIYSPHVVNLTLVDLPGITKVAVGDQPEDIEDQIKKLVMKYIENPNSIILSVSAANNDIANSESLKYAKRVDPDGDRTLAILTKIDLMDKGTDAMEMLSGQVIPVKLGIIGIINRSQKDINENKTIKEQLIDEKAFFEEHYKEIAHRNGISFLSKRLSQLLISHIQKCLPGLKDQIAAKLCHFNEVLESCGKEVKNRDIIFDIASLMSLKFKDIIDGTATILDEEESLIGGPKFREIFDVSFKEAISYVEVEIDTTNIVNYISNHGGPRPSVFAPENLFEELVFKHIKYLRDPSIECIENCHAEMEKVIIKLIKDPQVNLTRLPNLEIKINSILKSTLDECLTKAEYSVNELIEIELSSVNTDHPDFEKTFDDESEEQSKIEQDAQIIEYLVKQYFPIVKKTVNDQVPKIAMYKIINYMKKNLQNVLLKQLFNENDENLLQESEDNAQKRENAKAMIKALKVAKKTIEVM